MRLRRFALPIILVSAILLLGGVTAAFVAAKSQPPSAAMVSPAEAAPAPAEAAPAPAEAAPAPAEAAPAPAEAAPAPAEATPASALLLKTVLEPGSKSSSGSGAKSVSGATSGESSPPVSQEEGPTEDAEGEGVGQGTVYTWKDGDKTQRVVLQARPSVRETVADAAEDGVIKKDGVIKDVIKKDGVIKDVIKKDGVIKDVIKKDGVIKDVIKKDGVIKDVIKKDGVIKDVIKKDGVIKDVIKKDGVIKDVIKKDGVIKDVIKKDGVIKDVIKKGELDSIVREQSERGDGEGQPVFRSESGGGLMTLPGGIVLALDPAWDRDAVESFFSGNGIALERASELDFLDNGFFVETEPGFPSLELANTLASQDGVILSSPNWAREVESK